MPGIYHCEHPRCGLPLCIKHRVRKAGGNLCARHKDAVLVQQDAVPQSRFRDPGEAIPHVEEFAGSNPARVAAHVDSGSTESEGSDPSAAQKEES